uniref:Mitochondrial ATP synthase subunit f n=1 Tax=Pseudodiaptomus poplesia TaxID=213370 RepID=A0A0U2UPG0_9MAXI|nr:mitochondrial ATP synthase subunit f [Pseudodiaptomus poplesia]ALS04814.1 hypothetical protein [Pseudodiaptomus poplesia]
MLGLGELPKEYNKAVHGPYDPAVFYGKKDVPLSQVKVYQLPAWLARRNPSPVAMGRAASRAFWRWNHKYAQPKYCGLTPILQIAVGWSAFFYLINSGNISHHKNAKYHW